MKVCSVLGYQKAFKVNQEEFFRVVVLTYLCYSIQGAKEIAKT